MLVGGWRWTDTFGWFSTIFDTLNNFYDFLFAFQFINPLLKRIYSKKKKRKNCIPWSTLKGKNLHPLGANSFLLEYTPFQKGAKTILTVISLKTYQLHLIMIIPCEQCLPCICQNEDTAQSAHSQGTFCLLVYIVESRYLNFAYLE